jgi:hypothetical protein
MRQALHLFIVLLLTTRTALHAADEKPIVGAIRWDGGYGEGGGVKAEEASLGPPKYHFRLPWFARVMGEGKVRIHSDSQAIMEQEIDYAAQAGLNDWAFLDYLDEAPGMNIALNHYLAAKDKKGIRYCLIAGDWFSAGLPETVGERCGAGGERGSDPVLPAWRRKPEVSFSVAPPLPPAARPREGSLRPAACFMHLGGRPTPQKNRSIRRVRNIRK